MSETIRIILVDDHSLLREGTRRILETFPDFSIVGEAADGEQALQLAQRLRPDVAILDIRMPKVSGVEVVRRIKDSSVNTRALILTAYDDDEYVLAAMQAGASGYLLKTARAKELADAIRIIHAGEAVLDPAIAAKVARLWGRQRAMTDSDRYAELSLREREIVELSAKGLRNKAIAERLGISVRTVEAHFNSIFTKLNVGSRVEVALYAASRQKSFPAGNVE